MSAIVGASDAPVGKLPLWQTIRLSYATYFEHFGDGLRIAALWLPPVAILAAIGGWLQAVLLAEFTQNLRPQIDVSQPAHLLMLGYALNLLLSAAAVSNAVAWHRLLLLKEQPKASSGRNIGTRFFWRYVGSALLIALIAAIPLAVVLVPMAGLDLLPAAGSAPPAEIVVVALAYVVSIGLLLRFSLLLPARATGNVTFSLKGAWQRTRGNLWRLFLGILACTLPPFLLVKIIFIALTIIPFGGGLYLVQWAIASAIALCCWLLLWPIWIGFLSHAYRQLVTTQ
jgi:hypothetical protein